LFLLAAPRFCFAELWPTLEDYVVKCVLIVKAKTIVGQDGELTFGVLENWKGLYDPSDFRRTTEDGRFFAGQGEHGVNVFDGQEIVFFFTRDNQASNGKLASHSTALSIRHGTLVYTSTSENGLRQQFTVEDFKAQILDLVNGIEEKIVPTPRAAKSIHGWTYSRGLSEPEFSPDGKWVAFTRELSKYMEQYKTWHGKSEIWAVSRDGSHPKRLLEGRKLFWKEPDVLAYVCSAVANERTIAQFAVLNIKTGKTTLLKEKPVFPKIQFKWNDKTYSVFDTKTYNWRRADDARNRFHKEFERQGRDTGFNLDNLEVREGVLLATRPHIKAHGSYASEIVRITTGNLSKCQVLVRNASQPSLSHDKQHLAFVRDGALWVRHLENPLSPDSFTANGASAVKTTPTDTQ
jgi:hypothetical protein